MTDVLLEASTAEEAGLALGRGYAVITSEEVAAECGAFEDDCIDLEDVLESAALPYGDLGPPGGEES